MKFLIVDDEPFAVKDLVRVAKRLLPEKAEILTASTSRQAIEIVADEKPYVVFLDINMPAMNGIEVAERISVISPETNIVFVTANREYGADAWKTGACAFLEKPVLDDDFKLALSRLTKPRRLIKVQCFGNFEVFYDDVPLFLGSDKAKEIFAYLVHLNGSSCSMGELSAVLWEERGDNDSLSSQLRNHIAKLKKAFEEVGETDIIIKERNRMSVNRKKFICDYYDYLDGDEYTKRLLGRGYMNEYTWAEIVNAQISSQK